MGYSSEHIRKRKTDIERKDRVHKKRKGKDLKAPSTSTDVQDHECGKENKANCGEADRDEVNIETGTSRQTDLIMDELAKKFEQLSFASKKIHLTKKIYDSSYGLMGDTSSEEKWKYYTGFKFQTVEIIYKVTKDHLPTSSTTALTSFNKLLLTLIKIRLNSHFKDLAYHFKVAPITARRYFEIVIDILYKKMVSLIKWPEHNFNQNILQCFKEAFHKKTTIIIDCFEGFIETPSPLQAQQQSWSHYKHHHTIKFLIGITPQGSICYISDAWGGRTSDKQMVEMSGFCDFIEPGNIVLADRGFLNKDVLGTLNAKLVIPAFTKGKNQLDPLEVEETRHIAHVRIHVERVIRFIRNKFAIMRGPIPFNMLIKNNENDHLNVLDKIIRVCGSLINMSPPIIPL